jgi:hypothetical protein
LPKQVGLSCREFNTNKVELIKKSHQKPLVYVSLVRSVDLKTPLNIEKLPYDFICTEGLNLVGDNSFMLPIDTENTQEYILASNYVITKAGWGMVSECICAQKPMLVIRRDKIKEDYNTLNLLLKLEIAAPISQEELNSEDINKLIKTLDSKVNNYNMSPSYLKNSSDEIAEHILSILT